MNKPEEVGAAAAAPVPLNRVTDGGGKTAKPESTAPTKKRGGKTIAMLAIAALLFGGGFWTAKATTDPTSSEEYAALADTGKKAAENRDSYKGQLGTLQGKFSAMETETQKKDDAVLLREAAVKKAEEEEVKKRETAVSDVEKKKVANTVSDGTWVVGVDIEAGTYRPAENVGSRCYWGIYASGSNGDDIIANDIPGGGLPSVTLAAGQDFKSARCGTWSKQ